MPSKPGDLLAKYPPTGWVRPILRRDRATLPFDAAAVAPTDRIMLDTTVYLDALKAPGLPAAIARLVATNALLHSSVAAAELAVSTGHLDPADARTPIYRQPLVDTLDSMAPSSIVSPSADAWIEAAAIAGICARIHGYAKQDRRKLLHDALIFLSATEVGAVLISRNIKDMDLLLNFRPAARILLYDRSP